MAVSDIVKASLEAIAFQKDKKLFLGLLPLIKELRAEVQNNATTFLYIFDQFKTNGKIKQQLVAIGDFITRETNILATVHIDKSTAPNAYVYFPRIDANHPLLGSWRNSGEWTYEHGASAIKKKLDTMGWVDLANSTVHGLYTKIDTPIYFTFGLLKTEEFTDEECTAIILHECGHVFSYFEYLGSRVTRACAMVSLTDQLYKEGVSETQRIKIITEAKLALSLKTVDVEVASKLKKPEQFLLLVIDAENTRVRSEVGTDFYDLKSFEYLSDQFADRHGAGVHLVTGLSKMMKKYGSITYRHPLWHAIIQAATLILKIVGLMYGGILGKLLELLEIIMCICINPATDTYDKPKDRFKAIKQQMILLLNETSDTAERKAILADIDIINKELAQMHENEELYEFIFTRIIPAHRKDISQQQLLKELESIGMNDLYVVANKLQTI